MPVLVNWRIEERGDFFILQLHQMKRNTVPPIVKHTAIGQKGGVGKDPTLPASPVAPLIPYDSH
jgi:hypothetical protein